MILDILARPVTIIGLAIIGLIIAPLPITITGPVIIGLLIGFAASRIDKTLGARTSLSLFASVLGSCSGAMGMFMWGAEKIYDIEGGLTFMFLGPVLGALIFLFATHLFLLKNRSLANSPAGLQNFSEPSVPISRFCTQCGNRLEAGRRFCPSCGSAAEQ